MENPATWTIEEDVVYTEVNSHAMLMSIEDGKYYSLSTTGTAIWKLLETPVTVQGIAEALSQDFDVTFQECESDVQAYLQVLRERNLVKQS